MKSAPPGPSLSVQKQEWLKQTVLDAYDRAGRKDPRWDNDARKLLQLSVATWDERFNELTGMLNAYQAATRAGCNDPLVLYVVGRLTTRLPQDKVAQDLAAVGCHPVTAAWPGPVVDAPGETWAGVDAALQEGYSGFPPIPAAPRRCREWH